MTGTIDTRLTELGIVLPDAPAPAGSYVACLAVGDLLYISGQLPMRDGELVTGKVGVDLDVAEAARAAKLCALNILAQASRALDGDLDRVARVVKLGGFVNCPPDFTQHPQVINGASDFIGEVFGEAGRHTRFAVGAGSLPMNAAVEIEAVLQVGER